MFNYQRFKHDKCSDTTLWGVLREKEEVKELFSNHEQLNTIALDSNSYHEFLSNSSRYMYDLKPMEAFNLKRDLRHILFRLLSF